MHRWLSIVFFTVMLVIAAFANTMAQETGKIAGRVVDAMTGEPIIGVTAFIEKVGLYAVTDIDGNYQINGVPPGDYPLVFQMMGYLNSSVSVTVVAGRTEKASVTMSFKAQQEVIVTGKRISNTEASMLSKRKKAAVSQDAISSEEISRTPDSNAADAAKRVTGITMVDDKYIYIRGLGDRYSSVMLENSTIPSPDPEKRVVPMDIFPVALLDNIVIIKSYSPDMPGDFAGGIVQINPKDYPEDQTIRFSIGTGYRPDTTFKDFYTYDGGKWDWFGVDDGTRKLPGSIGSGKVRDDLSVTDDFKHEYTPSKEKGMLPAKVDFEYGNSFNFGSAGKLGLIVSGLFNESSQTTEKQYRKYSQEGSDFTIQKDFDITESSYSTTKGALLSLGYTLSRNKLRWTSFYTHKSKDGASVTEGYNNDSGDEEELRYRLQYVESSMLFTQLNGEHFFPFLNDSLLSWTAVYSRCTRDEPDRRETSYRREAWTDDPYTMSSLDAQLQRIYSDHTDDLVYLTPSITIPFKQWSGLQSKVTAGMAWNYRVREADTRRFQFNKTALNLPVPVDDYFDQYSDIPTNETTREDDSYIADMTVLAGYGMVDLPLVGKLRMLAGARYEYADMNIEIYDPLLAKTGEIAKEPLEKSNVMPSVNLTYAVTDNVNLRLSGSKTVVRPEFREVTPFKYENTAEDEEWKGNTGLRQTDVYNADVRCEWFPSASEILAVSFFYKYLADPIEVGELEGSGKDVFTSFNADYAQNMGVELELRKDLDFITGWLRGFTCGFNFAYIYSRVVADDRVYIYGMEGKSPEVINLTGGKRPLQGQAPYAINTSLSYTHDTAGFTGSVMFNVTGRTVRAAGKKVSTSLELGDLYEEPKPRLDVVLKQRLWKGGDVKFTASNLIDPEVRERREYRNPTTGKSETKTVRTRHDGMSFGLSFGQKF